jgi:sialic acid synthase SpsE
VNQVIIGGRPVGDGAPCFVIAEAGANHNRDLAMARELIDVAAEARADAVKFQTYTAEGLYSKRTPSFTYLKDVTQKSTWQLIKDIELPREWQPELAAYAHKRGILFFSSPFDRAAVDELDRLDVPAFKIASYELVDLELIRHAARKGRPMILSTGLAHYGEMLDGLQACRDAGNDQVVLLHCVSLYPAPVGLVNLRAIPTLKSAFGVPVGFSDHTRGIHIPTAAVAMGANAIEKHYTVDRRLPGPDHPFAIEPGELAQMVRDIRDVEAALGDGRRLGPAPEEAEMFRQARRSLVAARAIPKGTRVTKDMLIVKRPGYGIEPRLAPYMVGRVAQVDIPEDEVLVWDMFE